MELRLTGKRALVTGANTGIGRAVALALSRAGARVAINYITRPDAAEVIAADLRRGGNDAFPIEADVSDAEQVGAMFQEMDRRWAGIDILVNNAAIKGEPRMIWEGDPAEWRRVLDVNLVGAYLCAREAMGRMVRQRDGVILNITSVHEAIPSPRYSAYTASKAGLSMLTRNLAREALSYGVRVVAVAPGAIRAPMSETTWSNPASLAEAVKAIPIGRYGRPEEVAQTVVVLCSAMASHVTGTTIFVDGGMRMALDPFWNDPPGDSTSRRAYPVYLKKAARLLPSRLRRGLKRILES